VEAARRLFETRDPSTVSLREIASTAGVTYGLVHRHFGTRGAVLAAVFRSQAEHGAEAVRRAGDPLAGLREVTGLEGDPDVARRFARMLALAVLEGSPPTDYYTERSTAFAEILRRIDAEGIEATERATAVEDRRVALVAALLVGLGWQFYGPFLQHALGLDDVDPEDVRRQLAGIVDDLAVRHLRP
jgi:AcrR family transcriptional regulator